MNDRALLVEVIAYAPTAFYHCTHCEVVWHEMDATQAIHQEQIAASLPNDLAQQYQEVSDWVKNNLLRYQNQITFKIIDAASVEGLYKSIKYGAKRYPAVIVNHRSRYDWSALDAASAEIARCLDDAQL